MVLALVLLTWLLGFVGTWVATNRQLPDMEIADGDMGIYLWGCFLVSVFWFVAWPLTLVVAIVHTVRS